MDIGEEECAPLIVVCDGSVGDVNADIKLPLSKKVLSSFAHIPMNTSGGFPTNLSDPLPAFPPSCPRWGSPPSGEPSSPGNPPPPPLGDQIRNPLPRGRSPRGPLPGGGSGWSGPMHPLGRSNMGVWPEKGVMLQLGSRPVQTNYSPIMTTVLRCVLCY